MFAALQVVAVSTQKRVLHGPRQIPGTTRHEALGRSAQRTLLPGTERGVQGPPVAGPTLPLKRCTFFLQLKSATAQSQLLNVI